jgi:choice-of-anchor B domain-containing protein
MKRLLTILIVHSISLQAQTYPASNISLIGKIHPNTDTLPGNKYSGCWGWYQANKNREYAISGASNGTYFIDITNPANPVVCDFVAALHDACTWREMKTYQKYCYIVSDVCTPNAFQIVDMSYLPDSVHVVYNSGNLFNRAHTIYIDQDKMYCAQVKYGSGFSAMAVFSLANPELPVPLRRTEEDSLNINEVHDMFVRNDTVYASAGWQGLRVLKLTPSNTFQPLGTYSGYANSGYNHSGWLTDDGKHFLFCDELPNELPMHLVNVQNLGNIQPVSEWKPAPRTTPHNPYIIGNKWAVVSCYKDGLYIYDISNPMQVSLSGFFDSCPEGGVNTGDYGSTAYSGNWGAYPYLPSGIIILNDMANGVFLLDATAAYTTTAVNPVGVTGIQPAGNEPLMYPNPASKALMLRYDAKGETVVRLFSSCGLLLEEKIFNGPVNERFDLSRYSEGCYYVNVKGQEQTSNRKLIIQR